MVYDLTWKPIVGLIGALVLAVSGVTAWTKGTDWIGNTFLATDDEVDIAVDVHRDEIDPKIFELAANQEILRKGQALSAWQGARDALERSEDRLYQLEERLKIDTNQDSLKRKRTLLRNITDGEKEVQRTYCAVLVLDGKRC